MRTTTSRATSRPRAGSTRRMPAALAGCLALVALAGACGSDDDGEDAGSSSGSTELAGTNWVLANAVVDGDEVASVATASLAFGGDGSGVNGSTGCNQFSGTFEQDGSDLTITLGPMTAAACTDDAATAQEAAIVDGLSRVASFSSAGSLTLLDDSGDAVLVYDAATGTLEGTSWTSTGVNNGNGAVESTAVTETITAEFQAEGVLSGFSGCNNYTATYETSDPDGLTITDMAGTLKACDDASMAVEAQYTAALAAVTTYELVGDQLTLRDSSGATQATFVASS